MRQRIAHNALWNLVSIGSAGLLSVAVPPFLTRALTPEAFGAWSLVIQMAMYVNLFGFGLQTVVARHIAIQESTSPELSKDAIVATAFWLLVLAGVAAVLVLSGVLTQLATVFPELPQKIRSEVAYSAILVSSALALTLPAMALTGVFVGTQRPEFPAVILVATRLALAVALVVVARNTGKLLAMASAYLLITAVGALAIVLLWYGKIDKPTLSWSVITRKAAVTLRHECIGLSVWNLAMLLVVGLDLIIVARLDYPMVPYYAVAATLVCRTQRWHASVERSDTPVAARMADAGEGEALFRLVCCTTRLTGTSGCNSDSDYIVRGE